MRTHLFPGSDPDGLGLVLAGLRQVASLPRHQRSGPHPGTRGTTRDEWEFFPEEGAPGDVLLDELERLARSAVQVSRPGWMGHMDPPPTWSSVLGAAVAALLNNNMLLPEMSPSFTVLEERIIKGFAAEIGLGDEAAGRLTAGGSLANLLALAVARDRWLHRHVEGGGSRHEGLSRMTVVASADAHASIARAAALVGLDPDEGLLGVAPDEDGRLSESSVEEAVTEAESRGRRCFCLVGTAGTTVLGAVDPLRSLARVARQRDLWFHVDGAYCGSLALLPERKATLLGGLEEADSITVNPQKWLYVAKVCALVLFREIGPWRHAMGASLPYGSSGGDAPAGIEGTRQADVLKLRLSLLQMGRRTFAHLVDESFEMTRRVVSEVRSRPYLELAADPMTNIVVLRWKGDDGNERTARLRQWLLERERIFLSLPLYRDRRWLRAVLLNPLTDEATIRRLFASIDTFAAAEGGAP